MRRDFAHLSATIVEDDLETWLAREHTKTKAGAIDLSGYHLASVRIDLAVG
jgi:hypothetical protein